MAQQTPAPEAVAPEASTTETLVPPVEATTQTFTPTDAPTEKAIGIAEAAPGELVFFAEVPGLRKEDVHVEIADGYLVVRGEGTTKAEVKEDGFYRMDRTFGSFYRSVPLPAGVTPEQITATFKDGMLEVRMPMTTQTQQMPTKIPIG